MATFRGGHIPGDSIDIFFPPSGRSIDASRTYGPTFLAAAPPLLYYCTKCLFLSSIFGTRSISNSRHAERIYQPTHVARLKRPTRGGGGRALEGRWKKGRTGEESDEEEGRKKWRWKREDEEVE